MFSTGFAAPFRSRSLRAVLLAGVAAALPTMPALAGEIRGTVVDGSETRSLQGAEVRLVELNRTVEASRDGSFIFADVPDGAYTLETRYVGADAVQTPVEVAGAATPLTIRLGIPGSDILVVGQGATLASSLSRQRAADGVESVLTRDGIGQFPDQNVAESLRRLPGINILNDQGEGRFVSVRGLDPELNAGSINGTRIPAPDGESRSVALDVIPAELIESIEVKKSLTPDMDGDTIGASIEINTTSAFDRKKDLWSVKLEGSYNDYADAVTPKASFDFSKRLADNFGIAGGISYYQRKFESDNIEAADWVENDDGVVYAEELQYRDYDVERKRLGGSLSLDWQPTDTTKLYARGLYSQFEDQEYRGDVIFNLSGLDAASGNGTSASFSDADGEIEIDRRMKDRYEIQKIKSLSIGGVTETGPWKMTYSGSWSESSERENGSVDPTRFRAQFEEDGVGLDFDYSDRRKPRYSVTSGAALFNNPATYGFDEIEHTVLSDSRDREWVVKGDIAREFAMSGGTLTVQAGAKARWRKKSFNVNVDFYDSFDGDYTLADVLGTQSYRIIDILPLPSQRGPTQFFNDNRDLFELNPEDTFVDSNTADYSVKEDIVASYLMGRWDSDTMRVIGGVRVEQTRNDIRANFVDTDALTATPQRFVRNYTNWLPSLTFRFEPKRDLVLRIAGYKSLVRPKPSNLAPRLETNEDREVEVGNPNLKPYKAWNGDASVEWYFAKNAALTAGVFYKSIKDFVVEQRIREDGVFLGLPYTELTTFSNGDTATIKGIELSYNQQFTFLPAPFDGLLLNANYTYTDGKGDVLNDGDIADPRRIPLMNASKHTANLVLGYEKGPISFRAAGTYRSKYLDELGGEAQDDRYVDNHFQLDLSAKYRILPGVRLFGEWINVTDAKYNAYQNFANGKRLLQFEQYSWTAKFGVMASF